MRYVLALNSNKTSEANAELDAVAAGGPVPNHIAIIMDGNGRWAKSRGKNRVTGHREGVRSVREIVEACARIDTKYLTLYTFSTENWKRPKDEVSTLMRILVSSLRSELDNLHENNIRFMTMGELTRLPEEAQKEVQRAVEKTAGNTGLTLNLALSYSGRWDIMRAMKKIAMEARSGRISPEDVDERLISSFLSTAHLPDPDLLIRTSGELRLSNFLLWELAYTELYISERYWPDFRTHELCEAIRSFQGRERRYGQVSEQLKEKSGHRASTKEELINAISSL
ncbi:MAG: isoprenyl transferase [Bacteroidetes bacterium]|nr:isoprenyl transferase [Bacteroidota bacterium]